MELWLLVALIWDFDTLTYDARASVQLGTWANLANFITDLVLYPEEGSITEKSVKTLNFEVRRFYNFQIKIS